MRRESAVRSVVTILTSAIRERERRTKKGEGRQATKRNLIRIIRYNQTLYLSVRAPLKTTGEMGRKAKAKRY